MLARLLVVSRCLAARGALVRRVGAGALLQRPPRPFSATRLFSTTGREASALVAGDFADSDYLRLSDEDLLKQCRVDTRRDSGPGGQHRNKVESAVRITHLPTGVISNAAEDRSQIRNKGVAIKRLRKTIACEVRRPEAWLEPINAQTVSAATLPPELAGILPTTKLAKKNWQEQRPATRGGADAPGRARGGARLRRRRGAVPRRVDEPGHQGPGVGGRALRCGEPHPGGLRLETPQQQPITRETDNVDTNARGPATSEKTPETRTDGLYGKALNRSEAPSSSFATLRRHGLGRRAESLKDMALGLRGGSLCARVVEEQGADEQ
mmetsp:Transcript_14998/g.51523  ORF Transcript_14998/g.51523 Transcript_14998/m.51523 type:complete len:324 (-) Transcript_14998:10-981(-)